MAFLTLPHRTRVSRLSQHRLVRDLREGLPDLPPLGDLSDLVETALEAGAKHRPALLVPHRRPRRRKTGFALLLVLSAGALALAYRWWRSRDRAEAQLIEMPPRDATPPTAPYRPEATRGYASAPSTPQETVVERAEAQIPDVTPPPTVDGPTNPTNEVTSASSAIPTSQMQPRRPQGVASSAPVRSQWGFGRGPSTSMPSVPAARPPVPGRPHPHLPR